MLKPKNINVNAVTPELAKFILANNAKFIQNLPGDQVIKSIQKLVSEGKYVLSETEKETLNKILV